MIARLSSPVEREIYGSRAAEAAGVERETMLAEIKRQRGKQRWKEKEKQERKALTPAMESQPKGASAALSGMCARQGRGGHPAAGDAGPSPIGSAPWLETGAFFPHRCWGGSIRKSEDSGRSLEPFI